MKRMAMIAASALLLGRGLAAQDTTKAAAPAPAPAPAPAAATPSVTVVEAVVAKSVLDRQPQDTGAAFPADVGQLNCWTKVRAPAARPFTTCGFMATRRWATSSCRWAGRPGARGAARRCRQTGPEPGTSK